MTSRHDRAIVALRAAEVAAGLRSPDGQSKGTDGRPTDFGGPAHLADDNPAPPVERGAPQVPDALEGEGVRDTDIASDNQRGIGSLWPTERQSAQTAAQDGTKPEGTKQEVAKQEVARQEVTESVARAIALRQLAMAPRSRAELLAKLRLKGCPDALAERVLDRLTEVGLIDDRAFAQMLTHAKHEGSGLARMGLRHQLRKKGIDKDLVEDALASITPEAEQARAYELAERKLRTMAGLDPQVQARRLAGMLARKGYPSSVVYPVVRDAVNAAPEHHRD